VSSFTHVLRSAGIILVDLRGGDRFDNRRIVRQVLEARTAGPTDAVLLNAAQLFGGWAKPPTVTSRVGTWRPNSLTWPSACQAGRTGFLPVLIAPSKHGTTAKHKLTLVLILRRPGAWRRLSFYWFPPEAATALPALPVLFSDGPAMPRVRRFARRAPIAHGPSGCSFPT